MGKKASSPPPPKCGQVYACSQHIRLRPIAEPGEEFCRPLEVNSERRAVSNG